MDTSEYFKERIITDIRNGLSLQYGIVVRPTTTGSFTPIEHWPAEFAGYDNRHSSVFYRVNKIDDNGANCVPCCRVLGVESDAFTYSFDSPGLGAINVGDIIEVIGGKYYANWGKNTQFERSDFDTRLYNSKIHITIHPEPLEDGVKISCGYVEQYKTLPSIGSITEFGAQTNTSMFIDILSERLARRFIITKTGLVLNTTYHKTEDA